MNEHNQNQAHKKEYEIEWWTIYAATFCETCMILALHKQKICKLMNLLRSVNHHITFTCKTSYPWCRPRR